LRIYIDNHFYFLVGSNGDESNCALALSSAERTYTPEGSFLLVFDDNVFSENVFNFWIAASAGQER